MKYKKSLGQHFLTSAAVVHKMIGAAHLKNSDVVLEIGPGKGVLTKALLEKAGYVIAIEKDDRLIKTLQEKFDAEIKNKKLKLIHGDILTLDLTHYKLQATNYKLIANIPYYITGEILKKFLSSNIQPNVIVLLIQKEVAQRIVVREKKPLDSAQGKESILSLSVKVYGTPHYIQTVSARYFKPKPKVDSAILTIDNISKCFFQKAQINTDGNTDPLRHPLRLVGDEARSCSEASQHTLDEKIFFEVVKKGFAHKRKLLIKNIGHLFSDQPIEKTFDDCSVPHKARAENLSLKQWKCLCLIARIK